MRFLFYSLIYTAWLVSSLSSCKKYLDAKPDISLATPTTVQSVQGILDRYQFMNTQCSEAGEMASDNYYLSDSVFNALPDNLHRYAYLWESHIFSPGQDWVNEYNAVYNANVVLDNIGAIDRTSFSAPAWDNAKGSALFFRGKSFYEIAQVWAKAYDSSSAKTDPGIPLRLTSDFNTASSRANIENTYRQIILDLQSSVSLLPVTPVHPYRPSKPAAYGFLAKTYLAMRNYTLAGLYADSCLQIRHALLDYNTVDTTQGFPFTSRQFSNPEDIFHSSCTETNSDLVYVYSAADTLLYQSYDPNDLRRPLYYAKKSDNSFYFQGSYDGFYNYNGIATDEIYLIRAECAARAGDVSNAMNDLNAVLTNRWKTGTFMPLTASTAAEALNKILIERRKELVFRMCRFTDIKRLNKEGANITVTRLIGGQTYTLPPNDPRDALPIPDDVILYTGMQQN